MLAPGQSLHNRVTKRGLIICDKDTSLHVGYSYNYLDLLNWCPGGYGCLDSERTGQKMFLRLVYQAKQTVGSSLGVASRQNEE